MCIRDSGGATSVRAPRRRSASGAATRDARDHRFARDVRRSGSDWPCVVIAAAARACLLYTSPSVDRSYVSSARSARSPLESGACGVVAFRGALSSVSVVRRPPAPDQPHAPDQPQHRRRECSRERAVGRGHALRCSRYPAMVGPRWPWPVPEWTPGARPSAPRIGRKTTCQHVS